MNFKIEEHSFWARIARHFFGSRKIAMVIGNTIHLSGVDKQVFLSNSKWLIHELVHIEQYRKNGFLKFLLLYAIESIRHGYYNNRFEIEARVAEENSVIIQDCLIVSK
ncbi:MAG TPA: hypothetical protein VK766_12245 [Cytophagaceae bacterium]|jgi:hypothetical protein|nr:hypothetical protein [Cytophagaceae bacterium]